MGRNTAVLTIVLFVLTSCTSSQREDAAWVVLTPVALVVGPIVAVSLLTSDARSRDRRAGEWQAVTDPIYLARIQQIESWSPAEDANRFWSQGEVVYWRSNHSGMRFVGLNENSASGLEELAREVIQSNHEVYSSNPELRTRAEALTTELTGVAYPPDHEDLYGAAYACFEETAARYSYRFNVRMASLTGEYQPLPDYSSELTMDMENPCAQVDLR